MDTRRFYVPPTWVATYPPCSNYLCRYSRGQKGSILSPEQIGFVSTSLKQQIFAWPLWARGPVAISSNSLKRLLCKRKRSMELVRALCPPPSCHRSIPSFSLHCKGVSCPQPSDTSRGGPRKERPLNTISSCVLTPNYSKLHVSPH